jgi:hypothetical protein
VLLCSLGACSTENGESSAGATPSSSESRRDDLGRAGLGSTGQGKGSSDALARSQEDAKSAAEQLASGDGLLVENKTGGPVVLIFPDGDTSWLAAGNVVTSVRPCRGRLPLRAENQAGDFIAEHVGPCRQRDTWTLD